MPGLRLVLILTTLVLAGCGNGSAGPGGSVSAEAIGAGLDPGGYEIGFSGTLANGGPWESERPPASVLHNSYREQRPRSDFPGRQGVERSEGEGPYMLRIQSMISRNGEEAQHGRLDVQLPPNARAGEIYSITGRFYAEDGQAYAELVSPGVLLPDRHTGWRENGNIGNPPLSGEIRIGEIGEVLTASFELQVAEDADHPRYARVSGRVFQVPVESLESLEARTLRVPPPE